MSEIADFLRARIAERRALAEAASPDGFAFSGRQPRATVDHIAANGPEYVIADCDAKLALVDHYASVQGHAEAEQRMEYVLAAGACGVALKYLAQPFAGHADHKGEEWTP